MDRTIESQRPIVLLMEDNENVNAANRQLLEREGYAVRAARTLIEARRSLARDDPALVLLDIDLSDGNGLSPLPELGNVPVLVLSGKKAAEAVAFRNGARAFVCKPCRLDNLCRKVKASAGPGNAVEPIGREQGCRASPPLPQKRA